MNGKNKAIKFALDEKVALTLSLKEVIVLNAECLLILSKGLDAEGYLLARVLFTKIDDVLQLEDTHRELFANK